MGTLSSELSVRFGLRGASHVIATGCTSSTDALRRFGVRQIQSGRLGHGAEWRGGRADCVGNHQGIHSDENIDRFVE